MENVTAKPFHKAFGPPVQFEAAREPALMTNSFPSELELGFDEEGRPRMLFRVAYLGHFEQIVVVFTNWQNITQGLFFYDFCVNACSHNISF